MKVAGKNSEKEDESWLEDESWSVNAELSTEIPGQPLLIHSHIIT